MRQSSLWARLRSVAIVGAVQVVVLALLVAGVELLASRYADRGGDNVVPDYRLNHRWRPNSTSVLDHFVGNPEWPEPYTHYHNSQGWLERDDISLSKKPGVFRIFYLGDSFTEGTCAMDQSVPSIVERGLNDLARGTGVTFEVINTGTTSYSPTIFYLLTSYVLRDYNPDLIVVNIDMTDDYDDWKYGSTLVRDALGNPFAAPPRDIFAADFVDTEKGAVRATWLRRAQLFFFQYSATYRLLEKTRAKLLRPSSGAPTAAAADTAPGAYQRWSWCREDWDAATERNVANTLDLLRRLAEFCRRTGIRVMFTSVPHYWQYAGRDDGGGEPVFSSRPHREIARIARELGVPYLDSYGELKPTIVGTPQTAYYYAGDMHFNPRGYALWAGAQLRFLTEPMHALLPGAFYQRVNRTPVGASETSASPGGEPPAAAARP